MATAELIAKALGALGTGWIAAFAAGIVKALAVQKTEAVPLLLTQIKGAP
jgi:hypothetical protein